jgi:hypothetical protein
MTRRRTKPDGLTYRVYERRGKRDYSIGHKAADGTWTFRLRCDAADVKKIAELRREAVMRAAKLNGGPAPADSVEALIDTWFAHQDALPESSESKRATSTLAENRREAKNLKMAFGHMRVSVLEKSDAYGYLDACALAGRPAKGNKEIALMRVILEYAIRKGLIKANPFDGVEKLKTSASTRLVTDDEMRIAVETGRRMGGAYHIIALGLKTAWLCLRRSVEVRALTRPQITEVGIEWQAAKRQRGQAQLTGLIEWSDELRATIDEALAVKRNKLAGSWLVFGNLNGQRYTKGGWKKMLSNLMTECEKQAASERVAFSKFSLQDCRPKGVTDKLNKGDSDVMDATMHTNERMIKQVYDRRRMRVAKPVK